MNAEELITALVAGLVVAFRKDATAWWQKRKRKILLTTLSDTGMIYAKVFNYILDDERTGIERFILFEAKDSGRKITPLTPVYVTAILEDYRKPFKSSLDDIQNWRTDRPYTEMLVELIANEYINVDVASMPESKLKNLYISAGVKSCKIVYLHGTDTHLWYCSLASSKEIDFTNNYTATKVETATNRLKDIILKYL